MLEEWLDYHRATLRRKCAGLDEEQLRRRSCEPSDMSLLGLAAAGGAGARRCSRSNAKVRRSHAHQRCSARAWSRQSRAACTRAVPGERVLESGACPVPGRRLALTGLPEHRFRMI